MAPLNEPPPPAKEMPTEGFSAAVCAFVIDLGESYSPMFEKVNRRVLVCWELAEKMKDGRPFMLSERYNFTLHEKGNLYKSFKVWMGWKGPLDNAQRKAFDFEALVGQQCTVTVSHEISKSGGTYAKVVSIAKAMDGAPVLTVENTAPPPWVAEEIQKNKEGMAAYKTPFVPDDIPLGKGAPAPAVEAEPVEPDELPF